MKCLFMILFCFFFGFFDMTVFFVFFFLFSFSFLFSYFDFSFFGLFFFDGVSFFLFFLSFFLLVYCFYTSLIDKWSMNYFLSFSFFLFSIYFFVFLSFIVMNLFLFYIFFELIFFLMFFFLLSWGYSPERLQASFYMVFYTIVVSLPFLVYLIYSECGSYFLKFLFFSSPTFFWWPFFFLVFLVKLPVYGVHLWLPKAHVEAPVTGSMVLAGALLKLGGYGLFRFSPFFLKELSCYSTYFLGLGIMGGLLSCFLCLRQSDLKSFIAYSSVCHMGFFLCGSFSFCYYGLSGGYYMMLAHGFCSSCLFYILYVVYERFHSRSLLLLKGLLFFSAVLGFFIFLFSLVNVGLPPSFSFFSEVFILTGALSFDFLNGLLIFFLLFFAGLYGVFFYSLLCHGKFVFLGSLETVFPREFLNLIGHLLPLFYFPVFLDMVF